MNTINRRSVITGAATAAVVLASPLSAAGILRGAGDVRRLRMYSPRTGESINTVYWIEGAYYRTPLNEICRFMRDWRTGEIHEIDTRVLDILAMTYRLLDTHEPFHLISGYRSPKTNGMLRSKSGGVAKNSLHMHGQAADVHHKERSVAQVANAARSCKAGGVGRYSDAKNNFTHIDCGRVRIWGR